ncbi:MAG: substrate-binding domain-containing protein [Gorillibacterium sp.]|nr:substrate-binding domain-containing protein [Gorillibacterium sp.]
MKSCKKIAFKLALILSLAAILGSCSKDINLSHTSAETNIALILSTNEGDYWKTIKMGADTAAKEFNVSLIFNAPGNETDTNGQAELVRQALESPIKALVLAANDYDALAEVANEANRQGVPVITIDSEVNSPEITSFIGTNSYEAGRKAGQKMLELITTPAPRIAILGTRKRDRNTAQREAGILDVFASHQVEVVDILYLDPDIKEDSNVMSSTVHGWLKDGASLDGIIAMNTHASIGAAEELRLMDLEGRVKLVTFDHTLEALELIQEGTIQASVIQNPYSMGYLGIKYAALAATRKVVPGRIDTESTVIDLDNMFWKENQKRLFPLVK